MKPFDFSEFQWMNESSITFQKDAVVIYAPPNTDFFISPQDQAASVGNAPFFFTELTGDFVARVNVEPQFKDTFDAASIMVMKDMYTWGKACFEMTDFGTTAVVSLVTNGVSDDANGCNIDAKSVWLQFARVGNTFAIHYSLDGTKYEMMRYFFLPVKKSVKVGLEAQAPSGVGGNRIFRDFLLEHKTLDNLRLGL
ncbi:MAG: DUF1349 domain-containing protein [Christensenellales bacterium]|jgi:regulation of enolase protein 1 (concanavalin A-like superfamily)